MPHVLLLQILLAICPYATRPIPPADEERGAFEIEKLPQHRVRRWHPAFVERVEGLKVAVKLVPPQPRLLMLAGLLAARALSLAAATSLGMLGRQVCGAESMEVARVFAAPRCVMGP